MPPAVYVASPSFLHHPAISPPQWYEPLLQAALVDRPLNQRLYIAPSYDGPHPFCPDPCLPALSRARHLCSVAGLAPQKHERLSFEAYQPVLDQVRATIPSGMVIRLLADRGFVHERLLHYLQKHRWHFRLRLPADTLVHLGDQPACAIRGLCPPAGQDRFFQQVSVLGAAVGPVHLALACLLDQPDDPWFVVSDEQTSARTDATSTGCVSMSKPAFVMKNQAATRSTPANSPRPKPWSA